MELEILCPSLSFSPSVSPSATENGYLEALPTEKVNGGHHLVLTLAPLTAETVPLLMGGPRERAPLLPSGVQGGGGGGGGRCMGRLRDEEEMVEGNY